MTELEKKELCEKFDVNTLINYLEDNNNLVVKFLFSENEHDFPLEIFDILLREVQLLKKVCDNMEEWKDLIKVYTKNIISVKEDLKLFFFIQNGEIISIPVSDEVREKLENKVSLWIDESLI
ncbi:hypothetical protein [Fusobacterium ulcerans]|uniref:Uncharacterized protein n=1 Tax=Fusobacterium ulcerans 12-1B TaxID=457404 RepID=H1PTI5_9FUSO|nr:hypothetical protein [Fusobacterium ulcerans]EHO81018.1 hypothetical protein HMPREF0402_01728 [Fusobacterium ulcerans 12-1B]